MNTISLSPTRTRVNPTQLADDAVLYITTNESGRVRALVFEAGSDLVVGDQVNAKHVTRKSSYGVLTVTGLVSNGVSTGDVPDANLPLRVGMALLEVVDADEVLEVATA